MRGARPGLMVSDRILLLSYLLVPLLSRAPHPGRGCRVAWALPLKPAPWLIPTHFLQLLASLLSHAPHPGRGCRVARALPFRPAPWLMPAHVLKMCNGREGNAYPLRGPIRFATQ